MGKPKNDVLPAHGPKEGVAPLDSGKQTHGEDIKGNSTHFDTPQEPTVPDETPEEGKDSTDEEYTPAPDEASDDDSLDELGDAPEAPAKKRK